MMVVVLKEDAPRTLGIRPVVRARVDRGKERGGKRYLVVVGGFREGVSIEVSEVSIQGVEVSKDSDMVIVDAKAVEVVGDKLVVKA